MGEAHPVPDAPAHGSESEVLRSCLPHGAAVHAPRGLRAGPWPRPTSPRTGPSMTSRHGAPWPSRLHGEAMSSAHGPPMPQVGSPGIRGVTSGPGAPHAGAPQPPRAPLPPPGQSVAAHGSGPPSVSSQDRPLGGAVRSGPDAPQACGPSPPRALQAPGRPVCATGTGLLGQSSRQALLTRPGLPTAALDPRCCGSEATRGREEDVPGTPCPKHSGPW